MLEVMLRLLKCHDVIEVKWSRYEIVVLKQ